MGMVFVVAAMIGGVFLLRTSPVSMVDTTPVATSTPISKPPENKPEPIPEIPAPSTLQRSEIEWADKTKQQVVFTFDGGAGNQSIEEILAALKKHNVTATFFVTGKWAEQNSSWVRQMNADGHEIFNHTYNHPDLTTISATELASEFARTETILRALTGKTTKPYFRPPYGARNKTVLDAAHAEGYRSVYWTVDALDWKPGITDAEVRSRVLDNLKPGTIYMMHIGDDITGRLLDELLTKIKEGGYAIQPLTEAL